MDLVTQFKGLTGLAEQISHRYVQVMRSVAEVFTGQLHLSPCHIKPCLVNNRINFTNKTAVFGDCAAV